MSSPLRSLALAAAALAAFAALAGHARSAAAAPPPFSLVRAHVAGDVYHYTFTIPIGSGPNAALRIHRVVRERAPWIPRATTGGALLLHGDFSTFVTNFLPDAAGLAPYLAARNLDVWGVDRRWTLPTAPDADVSDFGDMGVAQELDDIAAALAFARVARLASGQGGARLALVGFSHGAQLAYLAAARDGARPAALRDVKALVPIDIYADIAPADADLRAYACANSADEYGFVADGFTDGPNDFFITLGANDAADPDGPSPFFDDETNAQAFLLTAGQTYQFARYTALYHLAAPVLADGEAVALRESPRARIDAWFANATAHESIREGADLDALWCGAAPLPVNAPLSNIRVPLYYLGAAGAFGAHGLYSAAQTSSPSVTVNIVQRFGAEREAEDYGHGDLLYGTDAPTLAWAPLAAWLAAH